MHRGNEAICPSRLVDRDFCRRWEIMIFRHSPYLNWCLKVRTDSQTAMIYAPQVIFSEYTAVVIYKNPHKETHWAAEISAN